MRNIALITARGGKQALPGKNLLQVCGQPMLTRVIHAAQNAQQIDAVFVSTNCPDIRAVSLAAGAEIIDRPEEMCLPDSDHGEAILHGAFAARERLNADIDTVTVLLGNTAMLRPCDIDRTIEALEADPEADSAMTVWAAQDDHPLRAMRIGPDGYLADYSAEKTSNTNRHSYHPAFFYDQGPWVARWRTLDTARQKKDGPACWWWMGRRSIPVPRAWVTGRDIHTMLDVEVAEAWIERDMWKWDTNN